MPFDWAPPTTLAGDWQIPRLTHNARGGLPNPPLFTARICQSEPGNQQCSRGIGKSPARAGQPMLAEDCQIPRFSRLGFANPSRATGAEPGNQQCLRGIGKSPPDTNNARGGLPNPRPTWLGSANPSRAEADSFQNLYLQIKNNHNLIVCQAEISGWSFPHVHTKPIVRCQLL